MSKYLGKKIKALRKTKKYSLEKLGKIVDISKSYLSDLENGYACNPGAEKLKKLPKL